MLAKIWERSPYFGEQSPHKDQAKNSEILEQYDNLVLVLVAVRFGFWTMAELSFSVDAYILDVFSNTAADTAREYVSCGHVAAGQQRPRAPTTPARTAPSRR